MSGYREALERERAAKTAPPSRYGAPVDRSRMLRVAHRSAGLLVGAALVGAALGILTFFVWPRVYESSALLVYSGEASSYDVPRELGTIASSAKLPLLLKTIRAAIPSEERLDVLAKRISLTPTPNGGQSLVLKTQSSDAASASKLARLVATTLIDHRREVRRAAAEETLARTREDLRAVSIELDEVRRAYDAFREQHGIADLSAEQQEAIRRAGELRAAAELQRATAEAEGARAEQLAKAAPLVPRLQVIEATDALSRARSELASVIGRLSPEHPRVMGLRQQIAALEAAQRRGRAAFTERVLGENPAHQALRSGQVTASAEREAALARAATFETLAAAAEERARLLTDIESEASVMLASLRVSETHMHEVRTALAAAEDGARAPRPDVRLAAEPSYPSAPIVTPWPWVVAIAAPFLALLITYGVRFGRDLGPIRIRTALELAWWGRGPVVGTTTWPRGELALEELVGELEDHAVAALGQTLVVPATEDERELACAFAVKLAEAPWLTAGILDVVEELPEPIPAARHLTQNVGDVVSRPTMRSGGASGPIAAGPGAIPHVPGGVARATVRMVIDPVRDASISEGAQRSTLKLGETQPTTGSRRPTIRLVPLTDPPTSAASSAAPSRTTDRFVAPREQGVLLSRPTLVLGTSPFAAPTGEQRSTTQKFGAVDEVPADVEARISSHPVFVAAQRLFSDDFGSKTLPGVGAELRGVEPPPDRTASSSAAPTPMTAPGVPGSSLAAPSTPPGPRTPSQAPRGHDWVTRHHGSRAPDPRTSHRPAALARTSGAPLGRPATEVAPAARDAKAVVLAWNGPLEGPALRRACRLSARVLVVVRSGGLTAFDVSQIPVRLGEVERLGYILVDVADADARGPDRAGAVRDFWRSASPRGA